MPKIVLTEEDHAQLEELLRELDPEHYAPIARFADTMPSEEWGFVRHYMRTTLRESALACLLTRAPTRSPGGSKDS